LEENRIPVRTDCVRVSGRTENGEFKKVAGKGAVGREPIDKADLLLRPQMEKRLAGAAEPVMEQLSEASATLTRRSVFAD